MKGKRMKAYRKLMHQYELQFGFREPYQGTNPARKYHRDNLLTLGVIADSSIIRDASNSKIDFPGRLRQVLQGEIKPFITQCDMRHLYEASDQEIISKAQTFERRRCNHHLLEKPLSTLECLSSVVDPKGSLTNKHKYIVATNNPEVRDFLRKIPGVPLVYINRSVMILEPMAKAAEKQRDEQENAKFKNGLKSRRTSQAGGLKRKHDGEEEANESITGQNAEPSRREKKRAKGPKAPNPLSIKKAKKTAADQPSKKASTISEDAAVDASRTADALETSVPEDENSKKRKRKRRPKRKEDSGDNPGDGANSDDN
ncbi:hypothetical protein K504DRAFT_446879 [Pleomassaria siparia CBS 279.74]|uniref:UTP23 sensor motif region domain-containing protein n=1 Tax=Pleomassaria siparia CBS 279.74 TaxID=1314801 RepID=A0A6G1K5H8_9PLEO|nr:hypothetical protein K504DRAFT_446879 [Pleomassaria siparia CBS 279.74]